MDDSVQEHRDRTADAWNLDDQIVLVAAGEEIHIPGRADQVYPFRSHSEHYYLTDHERPGSVLAFDPRDGWTDFVPEVTQEERVWTGDQPEVGVPKSELEGWLAARKGRTVAVLGCDLTEVESDRELSERLREQLLAVRRPKDARELDWMREAARITTQGFAAVRDFIRPGVSERQVQIEIESAFLRAGGHGTAYDTIVGFASNAAVFHFSPSERVLEPGQLVLIDAGAEYLHYSCDVTRTYPADAFTPRQRDLYAVVLEAEKNAVAKCRPGKEFKELHLEAAVELTQGLVDLGYLRGDPESLVEQDAHALFFPHGLGHLVGLGVRDASGRLPGREPSKRPGLKNLRTDMPLGAGFVTTIEPGLYFIPALLDDPENRERYARQVAWDQVDAMRGTGGIRIEDNVLVTGGEPEILTAAIPKELHAL